jgi:hypothetical protein
MFGAVNTIAADATEQILPISAQLLPTEMNPPERLV